MFGDKFDVVTTAESQAQSLEKGSGLNRPNDVITQVQNAVIEIRDLSLSSTVLSEDSFEKFVERFEPLFGRLWPPRELSEKSNSHPHTWKNEVRLGLQAQLKNMMSRLAQALRDPLFDSDRAEKLLADWRESGSQLKILEEKLKVDLVRQATLMMSTIGSSHKLPSKQDDEKKKKSAGSIDDYDDGLVDGFSGLSLDNKSQDDGPETVVIFDEAGCIPAYELLGLSRLSCTVKSLVLVGDVHQLPPYDPGGYDNCKQHWQKGKFGRSPSRCKPVEDKKKVQSLLSVSRLTVNDAKVQLTTQYRVPRDIADLLNSRIYKGTYETPESAKVPRQGFRFIHVPFMESKRRQYVNDNEVDAVVELVRHHLNHGNEESIMILTPVRLLHA